MATAATTGGPSHAAREARRRRIIERGSDRLALITGRIQSLPPDPEPDQSHPSTCSPGLIADPDLSQHEDAASNEESRRERLQHHAVSDKMVEPPSRRSQNGNIQSRSMAVHNIKEESPQISSSTQRPAQDHQREQTRRSLFTTAQIRSSIAASENIRMSCSVAAALLVLASYMRFPLAGGFLILRPVYLLLLTNITIVLGRVILGARSMELRTGRSRAPTVDGNPLADQLGKALELGLLMQKILGALFMDFSIYAVVLVSGLSLVPKHG